MAQRIPGHQQPVGSTRTLDTGSDGSLVRRTVLPGGLRVVSERVPGVRSATIGLWVGIGSRDEQPSVAGAAHYLEHLLFKQTANRDATRIAEEIDAVGGEINAFTAKEHTCYFAQVLDADLELAVDLVTDVVFRARCADADVELERKVVLDEIAMRDDDPEDALNETFVQTVLPQHPLGRSVLGTEESVTGMSASALRGFYTRRYRPHRMVLSVAGNIDHGTVLRLVRRRLRDRLSGEERPRPPRSGRARAGTGPRLALRTEETEQAHLMLGMRAPGRHDERRYALSVLNAALGGGMSSRLFQEVRERRGLAYQVHSSVTAYADTGHLDIYAGCRPANLGAVADVVRGVLTEVAEHGLGESEIARAKGQLRGGLVLGMEDTASRMMRLGKNELNYGRHRSVHESVAGIEAVTQDDIAALARALLPRPGSRRAGGRTAAAVVGPYAHTDDLPDELHEVMS